MVGRASRPGRPTSPDAVEAGAGPDRAGTKLKPAVAEVAGRTGLAKNLLYDRTASRTVRRATEERE